MELILIYPFYLVTSLWLTWFVGNNLHRHGRAWTISLLEEDHLSDKVNNMLLLGYRLLNVGYILFTLMRGRIPIDHPAGIIEFLSVKLGIIITILAYLHYQNIIMLIIFSKLKSKYKWEI